MPNDNDLTVTKKGKYRDVVLSGWHTRYDKAPAIRRQIAQYCEGDQPDHLLLYRADADFPVSRDPFVLGLKPKPCYCLQDKDFDGSAHARALCENRDKFKELANDYSKTRMAEYGDSPLSVDLILDQYDRLDASMRYRFIQVLLYATQYQNTSEPVKKWKKHLFTMSSTFSEEVAAWYAAGQFSQSKEDCGCNELSYIVEYAPPQKKRFLFAPVSELIADSKFNLGEWFRDRDREVMIPLVMFPHFVLGYSKLSMNSRRSDSDHIEYDVEYVPNRFFKNGEHSIANPPDLNGEQNSVMEALGDQILWVSAYFDDMPEIDVRAGFQDLFNPSQSTKIGPPGNDD